MSHFKVDAKADKGHVDELDRILEEAPQVLKARDSEGKTLLILACQAATGNLALPPVPGTREQHAAVDRILAAGADPSAGDDGGFAPLHAATMTGNLDLAPRLLVAGAPREGRLMGADGGSPLALALFYAKTEMGQLLADPPVPDNLRTAAALGRNFDRFVDGDHLSPQAAEGADFYRPLPIFPEWNRTNSRQELLDRGADPTIKDAAFGGTPLGWAQHSGAETSIALLTRQ